MARLQYQEQWTIGCHHPQGGQPNPNPPAPAPDRRTPAQLRAEAARLHQQEEAAKTARDYTRAQELENEARALEAQATELEREQPPAAPPPPANQPNGRQYGGGVISRDEAHVAWSWHNFLRWMLPFGSAGILAWLVFLGFQWGWHSNPCKPPCVVSTPMAPASTPPPLVRQPEHRRVRIDPTTRQVAQLEKAATDLKAAADKLAMTTATPAIPNRLDVRADVQVHQSPTSPTIGPVQPQAERELSPEELERQFKERLLRSRS